ncbi:Hypothetical protein D9617_10g072810 [Elsinoe fawcettii]|nr:Hypothetical protein D9617_10g072810 [Elsinoe fawcettii]
MHFTTVAGLCGLVFSQAASANPLVERANPSYQNMAHTAIKVMMKPGYYKAPNPAPWQVGWWNNAQVITLLADLRTQDNTKYLKNLVDGKNGLFNYTVFNEARNAQGALDYTRWFDDRLWWVVALIKTYDITKQNYYLATARKTFARVDKDVGRAPCGLMNNAYPDVPHGSSTITQELYVEAAALLAVRVPKQKTMYLNKATTAWQELKNLTYLDGFIQGDAIRGDGTTEKCYNNYAHLTYMEGVGMAAMVAMYEATKDTQYLDIGQSIAEKTLSPQYGLVVNGTAHEGCDDDFSCDGDLGMFKGIMQRGFWTIHKARPTTANGTIPKFLKANADSIWNKARDTKSNLIGLNWAGPYKYNDRVDYRLTYHISGAMGLVYASLV